MSGPNPPEWDPEAADSAGEPSAESEDRTNVDHVREIERDRR